MSVTECPGSVSELLPTRSPSTDRFIGQSSWIDAVQWRFCDGVARCREKDQGDGFFLPVWVRAPPPLVALPAPSLHGSRGSWCRMSADASTHGPRGADRAETGVRLCFFHNALSSFPGLAVQLLELESQFTRSLTQARVRWDVAEWQDTKGKHGTNEPQNRDREICICTDEN